MSCQVCVDCGFVGCIKCSDGICPACGSVNILNHYDVENEEEISTTYNSLNIK